jgi:hypothetical protein
MAKGDKQTNEDKNTCNKTHTFSIPNAGIMQTPALGKESQSPIRLNSTSKKYSNVTIT